MSVLDRDFGNVSAGDENDWMAVFSHFLVALAGDYGTRDQDPKLPVSQPRNFANVYVCGDLGGPGTLPRYGTNKTTNNTGTGIPSTSCSIKSHRTSAMSLVSAWACDNIRRYCAL